MRASATHHGRVTIQLSDDDFDALVSDALDDIPGELLDLLDNVVILVEDEPEDGLDLLGLYEGTPLTERSDAFGPPVLPDRIMIFRGPLLRMCRDAEHVREEVAITVVHEIAHHFGIDDERLHALGWG